MEECGDGIAGLQKQEDLSSKRKVTFWHLYAVSFVEGADMQLLPSTFRALEADIGLSPSDLALLAMCQALAQCVSAPFWGVLVDQGYSSKWIMVAGCTAWGILTFLLACVTDFHGMVVLRTLNGMALATLTPVSQAVIASLTVPAERGTYYGYCGLASMLGAVVCVIFATSISNMILLGYDGWRVAFSIVAAGSIFMSLVMTSYMEDVKRLSWRDTNFLSELREFVGYWRISTFRVIVVQGCFGSVPWSALGFSIMFFQYIGVNDIESALLMGVTMISIGVGNVIGGYVGDVLTVWSRFHGRPFTAQISVATGIIFILVIFLCVPREPSRVLEYFLLLAAFGLTASWCGCGVNRPILTEVVPESSHGRVIAWLAALEGSMAACLGAPLVGYLAENAFGYVPQARQVSEIPKHIREQNADALASGMLWMTILPFIACFTFYGFLHCTYKKDVEKVAETGEISKLT